MSRWAEDEANKKRWGRASLVVFAILFLGYCTIVLIESLAVIFGKTVPIHNVVEFLVLLASAVAFTVAVLRRESAARSEKGHTAG